MSPCKMILLRISVISTNASVVAYTMCCASVPRRDGGKDDDDDFVVVVVGGGVDKSRLDLSVPSSVVVVGRSGSTSCRSNRCFISSMTEQGVYRHV